MADVRTFLEIRPGMRNRLQQAIEALVDVLDSLEPDIDLEDDEREPIGDEEPRLGATTGMHQGHAWNVPTDEPDEAEPSLGWVGEGRGFHGMALPGYADDYEEENEHGGDVNDEGEHELTDDNGIGDSDGLNEQMSISVGGCRWVE